MTVVTPKIIDDLLVNPGVGFIAAPPLMQGEIQPDSIVDSRSKSVSAYRFTENARTWNHPDSGVFYCGVRWNEIEPSEGDFDWSPLDDRLAIAKKLGCTAVVRVSPYALSDAEDIPAWLREKYPDEPEFPFWRIDPNSTDYALYWERVIKAFSARYDGNPLIASVDMAIVGAWGEGGGTELTDYNSMNRIIKAYIEGFVKTPLQSLLHDPRSLECIKSYKSKVGFRVDCLGDMGGFHPNEWSHMLDFYPQNIVNFGMNDAWKHAPVVFEACWHMNDWFLQGWDIDYIVDEALKWHISSYNSKATTVPEQWKASVERWVRKMGYRFEIHRIKYSEIVKTDERLELEILLSNEGVAPCYYNYRPQIIIEKLGDEHGKRHIFTFETDIRAFLPDEDHIINGSFELPKDIAQGKYRMAIGFPVPEYSGKTLELAIEGRGEDGFYPIGDVEIV